MANTYKNIVITPNRDTAANVVPTIRFSGGDTTSNTDINVRVYTTSNGTVSFEGSAGQLLAITNDLSNVIFSVSDVSGIPSLEIDANGKITLAEFGGNVAIGRSTAGYKLDVFGSINASSILVNGSPVGGGVATATLDGANTITTSAFAKANAALPLAGGTATGRILGYGAQYSGSLLNATGSLGGIELVANGGAAAGANAAFLTFHRPSLFAAYFGLDNDNQFAVGGWSYGAALGYLKVGSFGVGTAASGTAGEIRATNNITAYYSDKRLKKNIQIIDHALDKVKRISGVTFQSNKIASEYGYTNANTQVGVIAQEIEAVLPEVVVPAPFDIGQDENGFEYSLSGQNYKTVQYDKLVPLLIEAIKEMSYKIDTLQNRIEELEKV